MQPGAIIREAWGLYKGQWQHLLPFALVVFVILALVSLALAAVLSVVGAIVGSIVGLIGIFWLQGALVEAVADIRDGRADLTMAQTFRRVQPRLLSLVGAGILLFLGVLIGFILLIVPGLYLLTIWSLVIPVVVLERRAVMEAFGRSRELIRGNGWNVFGVIVLSILILIGVSILVSLVFIWVPNDSLQSLVTDIVTNTLAYPYIALAWTLMYFTLRDREAGGVPVAAGPPPPAAPPPPPAAEPPPPSS